MNPNFSITDNHTLSKMALRLNLTNWAKLTAYVQHLPYGRNANRTDVSLVFTEKQGTCSSKHALLKSIALENQFHDVQLIMGIYKMNRENTPGIGTTLLDAGISHLPEAHCYLRIKSQGVDFTSPQADFYRIKPFLIDEIEISPAQVSIFKVNYHQQFIRNWIKTKGIKYSFDEIWKIREECIQRLSN